MKFAEKRITSLIREQAQFTVRIASVSGLLIVVPTFCSAEDLTGHIAGDPKREVFVNLANVTSLEICT